VLFTRQGTLKIKNSGFKDDPRPLDEECACDACSRTSRAFLHHLFRCGELTAPVLATLHNVRYYLDFMADLRQSIGLGALKDRGAALARSPEGPDLEAHPVSSDPREQRSS